MNKVGLLAIQAYRIFLSPFLGGQCRFHPTCSEYAEQAFRSHSFPRATSLVIKRLLKCQPFGPHGYDPCAEPTQKGK